MENSLKQRIIGAVVLIALAIIFLPSILKEKAVNGTFESKIPAKPEELQNYKIDTKKIDDLITANQKSKDDHPQNNHDEPTTKSTKEQATDSKLIATTSAKSTTETQAEKAKQSQAKTEKAEQKSAHSDGGSPATKTKINDQYKDAAWIVQVASFAKEANAINLVKKLQDKKYKSYRRKVNADGKIVYRVFVGPYIHKKDANKVVSKISKLSESTAMIKPFDPVEH